jgi:outer membrane lipoprotein-sorting protein
VTVTDLAELFELWNAAPESFDTLRATIRHWQDTELQEEALEREMSQSEERGDGRDVLVVAMSDGEEPTVLEQTTRLWLERPGRVREELGGEYPHTRVSNGEKLWVRAPALGVIEHDVGGDTGFAGHHAILFSPLAIAAGAELELRGPWNVAGRAGIAVHALPRTPGELIGLGLGTGGADESEFVVDVERGVLLRIEARLESAPFDIIEFVEIAFDEQLDPDLFQLSLEPGERVRSHEELAAGREHGLTVEQSAARASFPVFVPDPVWPGAHTMVLYSKAQEQPRSPETVHIHYSTPHTGRQFSLDEQAAATPETAPAGFEPVDLDGVQAWVWAPAKRRRFMPVRVRLVRDGSRIELSSQELDRDELLDIARRLVPASTEPPRFG